MKVLLNKSFFCHKKAHMIKIISLCSLFFLSLQALAGGALSDAFQPQAITPNPVVGFRSISFFDPSQKVNRELLVWYPVDAEVEGLLSNNPWDVFKIAPKASMASAKTKRPVIIVSHGYTGNPHQLSWLINGLIHHGFIVLGIQHRDLIEGQVHFNHWQRAKDVQTMIDQFSLSSLANSADLTKIGIAGFSLGGTTAIWVVGGKSTKLNTLIPSTQYAAIQDYVKADEALPTLNKEMMAKDWKEPRIKAAFIMAPAWAWIFDEESLKNVNTPVYLIAAASDRVLVTRNNAGFFARNIPDASYQEILGKADHYIFISALNEEQKQKADPERRLQFLFMDDSSINRLWIQRQAAEEAARFYQFAFEEETHL